MKRKHARTRNRDPDTIPTQIREQVIADHLIASRPDSEGYDGSRYAVVVYDLGTSYRDCFPTGDKDVIDSRLALQHFIGPKVQVQSCSL